MGKIPDKIWNALGSFIEGFVLQDFNAVAESLVKVLVDMSADVNVRDVDGCKYRRKFQ